MNYFVYQTSENDCGFASLKMLLANLNKDKNYLLLKKESKTSNYTFYDLIEIAKSNNLLLKGYKYEKDNFSFPKMPFLGLINDNHLVLVTKVSKRCVFYNDPNKGKIKTSIKDFLNMFSFVGLEIVEHQKTKATEFLSSKIIPTRKRILKCLLSIIPAILLVVGFFFVKEDSYIFIPIIFLSLYALFELVEKWYLIKEINFFDNFYIDKYFKNKHSIKYEDYFVYNQFKKDAFIFENSLLNSSIIISLIVFICIFNNPINVVAILVVLLLTIFKKAIFSNSESKSRQNIDSGEQLIKKSNACVDDVKALVNSTNKFVFRKSTTDCVISFIILIISFLMMIYTKNISVNFIIFYFGVFSILYSNFDTCLSIDNKYSDYYKQKIDFIYKCYKN